MAKLVYFLRTVINCGDLTAECAENAKTELNLVIKAFLIKEIDNYGS